MPSGTSGTASVARPARSAFPALSRLGPPAEADLLQHIPPKCNRPPTPHQVTTPKKFGIGRKGRSAGGDGAGVGLGGGGQGGAGFERVAEVAEAGLQGGQEEGDV